MAVVIGIGVVRIAGVTSAGHVTQREILSRQNPGYNVR
jgi:hypothetical protein